jgi:2-dehydro-3-deoxygluconokinase
MEGVTIQEVVRRGNAKGALAVMSPGDKDGLPSRDGLNKFLEEKSMN